MAAKEEMSAKKPENPERTHADTWRRCKPHKEKLQAHNSIKDDEVNQNHDWRMVEAMILCCSMSRFKEIETAKQRSRKNHEKRPRTREAKVGLTQPTSKSSPQTLEYSQNLEASEALLYGSEELFLSLFLTALWKRGFHPPDNKLYSTHQKKSMYICRQVIWLSTLTSWQINNIQYRPIKIY